MTRIKKVEIPEIFKNETAIIGKSNYTDAIITYHNKFVGWTNSLSGEKQSIPHMAFFAINGDYCYLVNKIVNLKTNQTIVSFASYYQHRNIYPTRKHFTFNKDAQVYNVECQKFCTGNNAIGGTALLNNPKVATLTLATLLEEQNPNSPANRECYSIDNFNLDKAVGDRIIPSMGMVALLTSSTAKDESVIARNTRLLIQSLPKRGYYVKECNANRYNYTLKKPSPSSAVISKIFPTFNVKQIREGIGEIPRLKVDIIALGLGSASTGILEQVARTNFITSYYLVDFDTVEEKNLRNQIYTQGCIGDYKAHSCYSILSGFDSSNRIEYSNKKFQDSSLEFYKSKYIILGFDTIKTRLEAFNDILSGKIIADYIIDIRYLDLEASIYFIDTSDKNQMEYYHQQLVNDGAILTSQEKIWSAEDKKALEFFDRHVCAHCQNDWGKLDHIFSCRVSDACGSKKCIEKQIVELNKLKITEDELDRALALDKSNKTNIRGTSCVAWNIIDIYKYASSYITCAIREIEGKQTKPFTHMEVTTDKMPKAILLKK